MNELVRERHFTHGSFRDSARVSQALKSALESSPNWQFMSPVQREACCMISAKMARIVCGDPSFKDHWADIAGYASLVD